MAIVVRALKIMSEAPGSTRFDPVPLSSEEQSRFVAGKNFYQNGAQWIDADAQKLPEAKRVRVQFNSPEYYDLIAKNPKALAWFSVGKNVQLLLNGTVYDVFE